MPRGAGNPVRQNEVARRHGGGNCPIAIVYAYITGMFDEANSFLPSKFKVSTQ